MDELFEGHSSNSNNLLQSIKKNIVVSRVKSCTDIQEDKNIDSLPKAMSHDFDQSSFYTMMI